MKKSNLLLILLGILLVVTIYLVKAKFQNQNPGIVSLRLAWLHGSGFEGFYVAKDKGFYSYQGLDVTLYPGGPDQNPVRSVAAGSDTFGQGGLVEVLQARDKGVPIKAIAAIFRTNPVVYFSLSGSGIQNPKDFAGKKIGVKYGLDTEIIYRALLKKNNVNIQNITEVPVKFDMTPLFRRDVDVWPGYINFEPVIARMQGYNVEVIRSEDYGIPMYGQVIFAREDYIQEHPEEVRKFLNATIDGWQYAVDHDADAALLANKYSPETDLKLAENIFVEVEKLVLG
ncbi:MAG TPA: ABC transporter substrate-binding protein, partial [Verrucomicrobiae bacterium]|nr:ABC transporter substrate-binding protein [Verrucomicrobiae bacterium]